MKVFGPLANKTARTKEVISQERYKVHFFLYFANAGIYIIAEHTQSKEGQITEWPVHMPLPAA